MNVTLPPAAVPAAAVMSACLLAAPAAVAGPATPIYEVAFDGFGGPAPGGGTLFAPYGGGLDSAGRVTFAGVIDVDGDGDWEETALYRTAGTPGGGLTQIAREGQPAPLPGGGFEGVIETVHPLHIPHDNGLTAFMTRVSDSSGARSKAILRGDGSGPPVALARKGQLLADGSTWIEEIQPGLLARSDTYPRAFDRTGRLAFTAQLRGPNVDGDAYGIFTSNGDGPPTPIVRSGQRPPDGNGFITRMSAPHMDDQGRVTFTATVEDAAGPYDDYYEGLFRGDGVTVEALVEPGDPAPDAKGLPDGWFTNTETATVSRNGDHVGFITGLVGASDPFARGGLFRVSSGREPVAIARRGDLPPDGDRFLSAETDVGGNFDLGFTTSINNAGQMAINARTVDDAGQWADDGIYVGDERGLTKVAREGDAAPDGNGVFGGFNIPTINDAGQVLFTTRFRDTAGGSGNADDDALLV